MQQPKPLDRHWIATVLSGVLRSDMVMVELEHYISVQAGGYNQEEQDQAQKSFNDIIESIADTLMLEIRLEKTRVRRQMILNFRENEEHMKERKEFNDSV